MALLHLPEVFRLHASFVIRDHGKSVYIACMPLARYPNSACSEHHERLTVKLSTVATFLRGDIPNLSQAILLTFAVQNADTVTPSQDDDFPDPTTYNRVRCTGCFIYIRHNVCRPRPAAHPIYICETLNVARLPPFSYKHISAHIHILALLPLDKCIEVNRHSSRYLQTFCPGSQHVYAPNVSQ